VGEGDGLGQDLARETGGLLVSQSEGAYELRVDREATPQITARLLNRYPVTDLVVEDPPIEAVIDQVYQNGLELAGGAQ
jgi:ABC-2 type transport system ATP-binding protein